VNGDPIEVCLRKLRRRWWGRRKRERMLAEVEDHLRSAAEVYQRAGMSREEAARVAVERLGPVEAAFRRRRRALAVVCVVVGAVGAVAAVRVSTEGHDQASHPTLVAVRLPPRQALLAQIVSRVDLGKGSSVVLGAPPRGFKGGTRSWATVTVPYGDQADELLGEWKAGLVAGTFRDLCRLRGLAPFRGFTEGDGSGAGVVGAPDHPRITAAPSAETIAADLRRVGLTPISIRLFHPGEGTAVQAVAEIDNAAPFLRAYPEPAAAVFGDLNPYAGTYLELVDHHGVAEISDYASAAGSGSEWRRPGLPLQPLLALYADVAKHR
jgi:hypothetical protein